MVDNLIEALRCQDNEGKATSAMPLKLNKKIYVVKLLKTIPWTNTRGRTDLNEMRTKMLVVCLLSDLL